MTSTARNSSRSNVQRLLARSDREPSISEALNSKRGFHRWNIDVAAHNANFPIVV